MSAQSVLWFDGYECKCGQTLTFFVLGLNVSL